MRSDKPFSLYVHIPFCLHKCPYCDFNTYAVASLPEKEYVAALLSELDFRAASEDWAGRPLQTIYFGGGTPSLLSSTAVSKIISSATSHFRLLPEAEITLEANPGTVNPDMLLACRQAGVNRLSLGAQSFNVEILRGLGRIHNPEQVESAVSGARDAGFKNISLDLIYAVSGQNLNLWQEDLVAALALKPEHISMYGLTIEKSTPFYQAYRKKLLKLPDEDLVVQMIEHANLFLPQHGLQRYELSNFACEGFEARHNMAYWNGDDYIGIGAGSHSFIARDPLQTEPGTKPCFGLRWANYAPYEKYMSECSTQGQAESWRESLEQPSAMFEFFFLGLRKIRGVSLSEFKARFNLDVEDVYPSLIDMLVEQGLATLDDDMLSLSEAGLLVADSVIENFADPALETTGPRTDNQARLGGSFPGIKGALRDIGFYRAQEGLEQLKTRAAELVARAGNERYTDKLEALPSYLDAATATVQRNTALAIDIGGTSTKVGLRYLDKFSGKLDWQLIFELPNDELKGNNGASSPLEFFAEGIAHRIVAAESGLAVQLPAIDAIGIVWSNAVESRATAQGITGLVTQREKYRKGEWFTKDVNNGDDIGAAFTAAFLKCGMRITALVVGNDTPLTMKALPGAHAGMVASTGMNGTIVKRLSQDAPPSIFNTEMGNRFSVPAELLGRADFVDDNKAANTMEYLVAGLFLPRLFCQHILTLSDEGLPEFSALAAHLLSLGSARWLEYSAEDITWLMFKKDMFLKRHAGRFQYQPACLRSLSILASELIARAAKMAAVEAYCTVLNQLSETRNLVIALDSRLARENKMFHDIMKRTLAALTPSSNKITLSLLKPYVVKNGSISVPMLGAAAALDNLPAA